MQNCDGENTSNRDFQSHQNLTELHEESPYMVTGAFEPQTSIPEFLTGRIHTQPTLSRQASTKNIDLNTTIPDPPRSKHTSNTSRSHK